MKKNRNKMIRLLIRYLFIVFMLLLLACCRNATKTELIRIDSIMTDNPTLALQQLERMKLNVSQLSISDKMYYIVLKTEAQDKLYENATSDSLMITAARWYAIRGSTREKVRAYYLLGSVYRDMNNFPKAINWYLRAKDELGDKVNLEWNYKIISQLMSCYIYIGGYEKSLLYEKEMLELLSKEKISCSDYLIDSYLNMGYIYLTGLKQPVNALLYLRKAFHLSNKHPLYSKKKWIWLYYAEALIMLEQTSKAKPFFFKIKKAISDTKNTDNNEEFKSEFYLAQMMYYENHTSLEKDSLQKYSELSLRSTDKDILLDTYKVLASYNYRIGNYFLTSRYLQRRDSLGTKIQKERFASMVEYSTSLHDYYGEIEKNQSYQHDIIVLLGCIVVLGGTAFSLYLLFQRKKKREELLFQRSRRNYALYLQLKGTMQGADQFQDFIQKDYKEQCYSRLRTSEIYQKLYQKAIGNKKALDLDFDELELEINDLFVGFTMQLQSYNYSLSKQELHLCLLSKAGFKNKEMAVLLCTTPSSISHLGKRIYEKLLKKEGNLKSLTCLLSTI